MSGDAFDAVEETSDVEVPADVVDADAETLVRRALDHVAAARRVLVSASVMVDREMLVELLEAALEKFPDELRQARWLLRERDEFLEQRQHEADALLDDVRARAERMVQRTEIVRQANQVAQRILDDAREQARRLRHEAEDFCDQKLAAFEIVLDRTRKTVQAGRERLTATPAPPPSSAGGVGSSAEGFGGPAARGDATGALPGDAADGPDTGSEGFGLGSAGAPFFDQDEAELGR